MLIPCVSLLVLLLIVPLRLIFLYVFDGHPGNSSVAVVMSVLMIGQLYDYVGGRLYDRSGRLKQQPY
ncbi:hypothetical protein SAMN05216562_1859 [Microbulbifer marinus]|uniref:Uncharacterized protein n=1 Tax=Microbulbifer marinus TaxID=658218 RepID=A0A1H3YM94_9GAMM|nr:hypothetical protein SAMN05216562_1859 [Microbulbifer marinus]